MHRRIPIIILACASLLLFAPNEAEAQADVIYACVNNSSGTIKIVDPLELCSNNEIELIWNAAGPEGPQGPPGEQGPPGPPGSIGEPFLVRVSAIGGFEESEPVAASFCALTRINVSWADDTVFRGCVAEPTFDDPSMWKLTAFAGSGDITGCDMRCIP